MILFDFDIDRPKTLDEAATLLARLGGKAKLMAGGTDLLPNMRIEITRPETVISLGAIAAEEPKRLADGTIRIDALSKLAALENSPLLAEALPMVAASAHSVAGNQIRQMGTLGGNLCQETRCLYLNQKHDYQFKAPCFKRGGDCCYPFPKNDPSTCWSVYMSDIAPALIALGASVEITGPKGERRAALEDLFTGSGLAPLALESGEILRAILVPPMGQGSGWGYHKSARRGGLEFGMAILAVTLGMEPDGKTCRFARIVAGAIREKPVRLTLAEQALSGRILGKDDIAKAADAGAEEANPLPHHGFTKSYLRDNIRVYLRRTLAKAIARAQAQA
jgi:4-hydroxybenzoyl-CoA reductase subunit beta